MYFTLNSTSQFRLATIQVSKNHGGLAATVLAVTLYGAWGKDLWREVLSFSEVKGMVATLYPGNFVQTTWPLSNFEKLLLSVQGHL